MAERIGDADKRQECVFVIIMAQKIQVSFQGHIPADQQGGKIRVKSPAVFRGKGFAADGGSERFQILGVLIFDPVTAGLTGIDFVSCRIFRQIERLMGLIQNHVQSGGRSGT